MNDQILLIMGNPASCRIPAAVVFRREKDIICLSPLGHESD